MLCVFSMERIQRRTNVFSASVYNTSTGSVSDRWYVKSRQKRFVSGNLFQKSSAKRFEKTCQSGTIFPFIKISATEKTWITIFVFKKMAAKIRRSYQKLTNAGSFSALLSQVRGGLDTTCLSFFVIANFCFYKKKYCSYKNSSMIFTLHRHFSGGERVFF